MSPLITEGRRGHNGTNCPQQVIYWIPLFTATTWRTSSGTFNQTIKLQSIKRFLTVCDFKNESINESSFIGTRQMSKLTQPCSIRRDVAVGLLSGSRPTEQNEKLGEKMKGEEGR